MTKPEDMGDIERQVREHLANTDDPNDTRELARDVAIFYQELRTRGLDHDGALSLTQNFLSSSMMSCCCDDEDDDDDE